MNLRYTFFLLVFVILHFGINTANSQVEPGKFYLIEGKIVDNKSGEPIVFASIYINGTGIGTVTNMDGEFTLKVPLIYRNDYVTISSIGYENHRIGIGQFSQGQNLIKLELVPIQLQEVTIINRDANEIISSAIENIRYNYSKQPVMVSTFYREHIKKGKKYVSVSEAVLNAYKSSYSSVFDLDRVSILKARQSSDFKNQDTMILKLQGGPYTMFQLDFVKNPGELFDRNVIPFYRYELNGQVSIDGRMAYIIDFQQLPDIEVPFYKGRLFIGIEDLSFIGAEFHLNEDKIDKAREFMVKSEPKGVHIDINKAHYLVTYRYYDDKWHLAYVRSEIAVTINWEKNLFKSSYTTKAEMAITDIDTTNITKFDLSDAAKSRDIFVEQISDFEDPEFWGDYNIIRPEESIQTAIRRMNR